MWIVISIKTQYQNGRSMSSPQTFTSGLYEGSFALISG